MGERIAAAGVPVRALGMCERPSDAMALFRLIRLLRGRRPHVVQTWLYHADLLGGLAAWAAGVPVAWGIRNSELDPARNRRSTIWIARACARLSSSIPRRIVCCSENARRVHVELGYARDKMVVIPNGFDLRSFRPDPVARESVRRELGVSAATPLIGLIARFDPEKDHETFLEAARLLSAARPGVHFVLCGEGIDEANKTLGRWITERGIASACHRLGMRQDTPRLTAALDVASLSSLAEGFPNVVGEAMACGVPCVVTDVGECAAIVGDTGRVVPARSPSALAQRWGELLAIGPEGRSRLGAAARRRIEAEYDLVSIAHRYSTMYADIVDRAE